jgi:iron complex outermembrane receptor protein
MRTKFFAGVAFAALIIPGAAYAQSTGSADLDQEIVVTARGTKGVGGVQIPDTSKAKGVLTQEFIARQTPGNSILDTINSLPGVSFQNNDPFGSAGGTLTIRGFDSSRIGLTFDGIPLNDTGNYAVYSNQQLDPELIEQVNVSYGSTDVDSPTAAASGSTVNYRTIVPTDEFGARMQGSIGDYKFFRIFGLLNTGVFTPWGTKAWLSASHAENDVVFNNFGKIDKAQYNGRVYQPIGGNGDFVSVAGNYNVNRNNFFGSAPLREDTNVLSQNVLPGSPTPANPNPTLITGAVRTPGTGTNNRFPNSRDELPYSVARCQVRGLGVAGANDVPNSCGTSFDERYNPSNTGSIRVNSRFTLAPGLVLTVDPSYQYTKANGGGTVRGQEGGYTQTASTTVPRGAITTPLYGFIGNNYYFGRDLNSDGDLLDRTTTAAGVTTNGGVTFLAPSQTVTNRYGVNASLRYDFDENNTVRVSYVHDYGRHRQTGELGLLQANGFPQDVFPINNPLRDVNGRVIQKRDRLSFATLDQVSGEYRGDFGAITVNLGVRAPFFKRQLNQFCFTTAANGNVDCLGRGNTADNTIYATANPNYAAPQSRTFKYNRVLPNGGVTFKPMQNVTLYANYSKGLQVPGTDNLYQTFFYALGNPAANPAPETTDNLDAGIRYTSSRVQATLSPWYTRFQNRLASAFDVDTQQTIYRNLGRVDKYGIDGSISYRPIPEMTVYAYGSYLWSEIKNNVQIGSCPTTLTAANTTNNCTVAGAPIIALTAGKRESAAPVYSFGGRIQGEFGPVFVGVQGKRTGPRYLNDQNLPNLQCTASLVNQICPTAAATPAAFTGTRGFEYQVYGAKAPGYTTFDVDARIALDFVGLNKTTYLQLNVQNIFDKYYVGGFGSSGGSSTLYNVPFIQIGSPRAFIGTLNVQF